MGLSRGFDFYDSPFSLQSGLAENPYALRVRRDGVQLVNPHPECLAEITVEYPYLQYRYEQFRLPGY